VSLPAGIKDIALGKKTSMTIFGDTGIGKTRLIGGGGGDTLILRPPTDNTDSIRVSGVREWIVKDHAELLEAMEFARHEGDKFDWIWWDSASMWQYVGLADVFQAAIDRNKARADYGPDKGEYGINMSRISEFLRQMHGCSQAGMFNFGVTALASEISISQDPEAVKKLRPSLTGKDMAQTLMGLMNIVAFYEIVEQNKSFHRILRSQPTDRYDAKDQLDAFPKGRLVDPEWSDVSGAIEKARSRLIRERGTTTRRKPRRTTKGKSR
jgi:hypothetical protein